MNSGRVPYVKPASIIWRVKPVPAALSAAGIVKPWIPARFGNAWRDGRLYVYGAS